MARHSATAAISPTHPGGDPNNHCNRGAGPSPHRAVAHVRRSQPPRFTRWRPGAAPGPTSPVEDHDPAAWAAVVGVHLTGNLFNAHYERPAMIALAGDVDGRRVLDAGWGSGPLSAALSAKGPS